MKKTLKDLLMPPFRGDHIHILCGVNEVHYEETRVIDIRGWGYFQKFENGDQIQDELRDFTVAALNEKAAREWGERKRLIEAIAKSPHCGNFIYYIDKYIEGLRFAETCRLCPEQYDVFDKTDKQVGYVRLRHGYLRCDYPKCGGETIYEYGFNDAYQGCFDNDEDRDNHLSLIAKSIQLKIKSEKEVNNE